MNFWLVTQPRKDDEGSSGSAPSTSEPQEPQRPGEENRGCHWKGRLTTKLLAGLRSEFVLLNHRGLKMSRKKIVYCTFLLICFIYCQQPKGPLSVNSPSLYSVPGSLDKWDCFRGMSRAAQHSNEPVAAPSVHSIGGKGTSPLLPRRSFSTQVIYSVFIPDASVMDILSQSLELQPKWSLGARPAPAPGPQTSANKYGRAPSTAY